MQGLVPRTVLLNNNIAVPNPLLPNADRDKGVTLRRIPSLTALPHWQLRKGACRMAFIADVQLQMNDGYFTIHPS